MVEDLYRQYKEDETDLSQDVNLHTPRASAPLRIVSRRIHRPRRRPLPADYVVFKATIAAAVEDIKLEIRGQHQQTRETVETARKDILSGIKSSPAEYIKLVSEFGSLFVLFCLAIRWALGIELLNTAFAMFTLFALGLYWIMARLKQESDKRANPDRQQ